MRTIRYWLVCCAALASAGVPAEADEEASNYAHIASGTYGRCFAKSIPAHVYDPEGEPRQQGRTLIFGVNDGEDELIGEYPWFAQQLYVRCGLPDSIIVVRLGPWHRGHDPEPDHLAIAFYKGGKLVKSYSTLDIAGDVKNTAGGISKYQNVLASASHYTVFEGIPRFVRRTHREGVVFSEDWIIEATTIDGRLLRFEIETGELL